MHHTSNTRTSTRHFLNLFNVVFCNTFVFVGFDSLNPTWDPVERRTHGVAGADPVGVLDDLLGGDASCGGDVVGGLGGRG